MQIERGSVTIECEYDEAFSAPEVIKLAIAEAGKGGVDGVFVNCFGDPGVRAVREVLSVPVFGGFEPAIYLALGLGDTVGIVTVLKNVVPMIRGRHRPRRAGEARHEPAHAGHARPRARRPR